MNEEQKLRKVKRPNSARCPAEHTSREKIRLFPGRNVFGRKSPELALLNCVSEMWRRLFWPNFDLKTMKCLNQNGQMFQAGSY